MGGTLELIEPGARDHDLDGAELGADVPERLVDGRTVGDVHLATHRPCAPGSQLLRGPLGAFAIEVEQRDAAAAVREVTADGPPHARRGSGDHGDPAHRFPSNALIWSFV